ncbi:MAG: carotenoid 1,2-hydratase [Desulfobacterales bacterium]|nr:MAG: carotenoid 1,2-hydratase [Desulfobacterales bacterium]
MNCSNKRLALIFLFIFVFIHVWVYAEDAKGYLTVTGPCDLKLPKDHASHPGYRTEWWYYTGNLQAAGGNRYGFQFTIFRRRIIPSESEKKWPKPSSAWRSSQIYLAHAAISDLDGKHHYYAQRVGRGVLGIAGEIQNNDSIRIFLKKWSTRIGPIVHHLRVVADPFSFDLNLTPTKPPVFHGKKGYSQKGSTPERASCYYSFTRLETNGQMTLAGKTFAVNGLSWMDHEFSTAPLEPGLVGWDWFSLQLSDNTEIMIYLLRQKDGRLNPASSGTYIRSNGKTKHLSGHDIEITVTDTWSSPNSRAVYPARWRIRISSPAMELIIVPNLADQEMRTNETTGVIYWEGSVSVRGLKKGRRINGQGYVELTGYAKAFDAPL